MAEGKAECWKVFLTVVRVIWHDLRKVVVEAEKGYGSDTPLVMVGQYLWGASQAYIVMDNFLWNNFSASGGGPAHYSYLIDHMLPWVEVSALNKMVETKAPNLVQMEIPENSCGLGSIF